MQHFKPELVALVVTLCLAGTSAQAQDRRSDGPWHHGPPGATEHLARLERALELTPEQSRLMLQVLQDAEADRTALRERAMEQFRPEICALRDATEAEILALLTEEQVAEFQALKQERSQRQGRGRDRASLLEDCDN